VWYAKKNKIPALVICDAAAPGIMIAYAIGRIGCQVSGDGDWGVYNSAYISDASGNVQLAQPGEFKAQLQKNTAYFLEGRAADTSGNMIYVTDRTYASIDAVPHRSIKGMSFLPKWFFAYSYPQNVNKDGVLIPGITDEHNRMLPLPVFPTPLYETILCTLIFLFLWAIRRSIKTPLVMFGIYLVLNGIERFSVELIRVNKTYSFFGFHPSQAEIIASMLALIGIVLIIIGKRTHSE